MCVYGRKDKDYYEGGVRWSPSRYWDTPDGGPKHPIISDAARFLDLQQTILAMNLDITRRYSNIILAAIQKYENSCEFNVKRYELVITRDPLSLTEMVIIRDKVLNHGIYSFKLDISAGCYKFTEIPLEDTVEPIVRQQIMVGRHSEQSNPDETENKK